MHAAEGCFCHLQTIFQELEECRGFVLLKCMADLSNYQTTKQAKIVAMTCTHAALKRNVFLQLGYMHNNLLMEESAQIKIETFIPVLLQRQEDGYSRLKRSILLPHGPELVYKICSSRYILYIELNAQGRARPNIAKPYNWRYRDLGDLPIVREQAIFHKENAGFAYDHQLVDVPDYNGRDVSHIPSLVLLTRSPQLTSFKVRGTNSSCCLLSRLLCKQCYRLQPAFQLLLNKPDKLGLVLHETTSVTHQDAWRYWKGPFCEWHRGNG
ncbi:hypothetical protein C5167_026995 [Papaver somniferum]|nr:hypothetical protein C5167_026995 [Papaver somniferum]